MIEDMQKTIDIQGEELVEKDRQLSEKDAIIAKLQEALKKLESQ